MTPKEKAKQLFRKFYILDHKIWQDTAKQCALIAIDEILENVDYFFKELEKDNLPNKFNDEIEYWNEIKQEINNL